MLIKTMKSIEARLQEQLQKWSLKAQWVGLRYHSEIKQTRSVRNDRPEKNTTFEDYGVMVEVMVDGHIGYFGTSDMSPAGLDRAFTRALDTTRAASVAKIHRFDPAQIRPAVVGEYVSPFVSSLGTLNAQNINEFLIHGTQALRVSDLIIDRAATAHLFHIDILLLSSSGTRTLQSFQKVGVELSATASDGVNNQSRSWNGGLARCYQMGAEAFNFQEIENAGIRIGREVVELLKAPNCPTGTMDLILMPDQMMLQIHESIGHPLELDRILGDERNYAGSSFVKLSDFGSLKYGSQLMNATFDPGTSSDTTQEFASYQFDDVGNKATKEYLIRNGVLVAGLGSLESQSRSKIPGVANARSAAWNRAPIDRMANINIEGGTLSLEDLIGGVEQGVLMHANKSWSIDDYRRKFQFTCEYGEEIRNGKIVGLVKNPNYRGTTVPFWNSLAGLGSKIENFGTPYCGKGEPSQAIHVGHSAPPCLFKNIEIFGGAS